MKLDEALVDRLRELGASETTISSLEYSIQADCRCREGGDRDRAVIEWFRGQSLWAVDDLRRLDMSPGLNRLQTPVGTYDLPVLIRLLETAP